MLSTQHPSRNQKTGPIATTYRSGKKRFGTCPTSCNLCDRPEEATKRIDHKYMSDLYNAVPRGGISFTYCHFRWQQWAHKYPVKKNKTVVNFSADTMRLARASFAAGIPTVVACTQDDFTKEKSLGKMKLVICPADKDKGRNCANCGGNKGPLCARGKRDYAVAFLVHGRDAKKAADTTTPGGCYGESGFYTRIAWNNVSKKPATDDGVTVRDFAKRLPYGTTLRHHIVGDTGKE
jgi:hypothetical protein